MLRLLTKEEGDLLVVSLQSIRANGGMVRVRAESLKDVLLICT